MANWSTEEATVGVMRLLPASLALLVAAGSVAAAPKPGSLEERVVRMERLLESRGLLEMLEQLEQQQMQMQLMPGDRRDLRRPIPGSSNSYMPQIYGYPPYGPLYGMGYTNPLYHTPAVSPWGSEPGLRAFLWYAYRSHRR